jgi:hypothetical protein
MPLILNEQLSERWFAEHINRITGSTAAGCLGFGMHGLSRIKAWKKIKGTLVEQDNWYKQYGVRNEAKARDAYERVTGNLAFETGFWIHPTMKWLGSSPDGLIGTDGILEAKCPQAIPMGVCPHCNGERCDKCDQLGICRLVPYAHIIQAHVGMIVCERTWCDYFCWTPNETWNQRIHLVPLFAQQIIAELAKFYTDYVVANVQPPRRKPQRRKKVLEDELELSSDVAP